MDKPKNLSGLKQNPHKRFKKAFDNNNGTENINTNDAVN